METALADSSVLDKSVKPRALVDRKFDRAYSDYHEVRCHHLSPRGAPSAMKFFLKI